MLTGAINRNFEGFGSVVCTTVVAKSKQTGLQHCYCLTNCLQTFVIEYSRLPGHILVDETAHSTMSSENHTYKVGDI